MTNETIAARVRANWMAVSGEVAKAARDVSRDPESVCLIGVSKYVDLVKTRMLFDAGCRNLGESRPQMLWQKAEQWGADPVLGDFSSETPRWHMIGHVQTNKLRRMLRFDPLIHSVDSERLLVAIDKEAAQQARVVDVLLEVNISGDEKKTGLSPESLRELLQITGLSSVRIRGLMAMAGWGTGGDEAKRQFSAVAGLRDDLVTALGRPLDELSMGMSRDFRQAILAGATMVRIGSALFEGVRDSD